MDETNIWIMLGMLTVMILAACTPIIISDYRQHREALRKKRLAEKLHL
jgi:hypothetical protein